MKLSEPTDEEVEIYGNKEVKNKIHIPESKTLVILEKEKSIFDLVNRWIVSKNKYETWQHEIRDIIKAENNEELIWHPI